MINTLRNQSWRQNDHWVSSYKTGQYRSKMNTKAWTTVNRQSTQKQQKLMLVLYSWRWKTAISYLSLSAALFCFSLMISASLERKNKQYTHRMRLIPSPHTKRILALNDHVTYSLEVTIAWNVSFNYQGAFTMQFPLQTFHDFDLASFPGPSLPPEGPGDEAINHTSFQNLMVF